MTDSACSCSCDAVVACDRFVEAVRLCSLAVVVVESEFATVATNSS